MNAGARGAGRLAALRGLRALPVHAGRDQERHADAVRDRLPAGLRGRHAEHLRPAAHARRRARRRRRGARAARCASCRAPASGHQAVPRAARAPRARSRAGRAPHVEPFARRRARARAMSADDLGDGRWRVTLLRPEHHARSPRASTARGALRRSLLSTHLVLRLDGGRFVSPLEAPGRENVNTFPVLAHRRRRRAARRGDRAARPPAARAREPRRPLRRHRDRGGAAAARPAPSATPSARQIAAAGPGGAGDGRARRRGDAGGPHAPCTARDSTAAADPRDRRTREAAGRARGRRSTASPSAAATRSCCALDAPPRPLRPMLDGRPATIERIYLDYEDRSTSASRSTTTPARS